MLLGSIKGALVISAFLPLFMFLPDSISFVKETKHNSAIYKNLQGFAPQVYNSIAKLIPGSDNFATKIQDAFPTAGTFNKLSTGNIDPAQINMFQQFMGSDESAMLKELQKQLGDDFKVEDINFDNLNMDAGDKDKLQKLLDKSDTESKRKPRKNRRN